MKTEFFKKSKNVIGEDITNSFPINETLITLIPKVIGSQNVEQFRSISLYNEVYKIISKIMANRFKQVLARCIGEQFAFPIQGRQIIDNIIPAGECVNTLRTFYNLSPRNPNGVP